MEKHRYIATPIYLLEHIYNLSHCHADFSSVQFYAANKLGRSGYGIINFQYVLAIQKQLLGESCCLVGYFFIVYLDTHRASYLPQ